jgi:hypothetical protein
MCLFVHIADVLICTKRGYKYSQKSAGILMSLSTLVYLTHVIQYIYIYICMQGLVMYVRQDIIYVFNLVGSPNSDASFLAQFRALHSLNASS